MNIRILLLCLALAVSLAACKKSEYTNQTTSSTDTYATTTTAPATDTTATAATTTVADKDKDFLTDAGKGGLAEVDVAKDAVAHAANADVKAFAQKLVDDHTKANEKLAALAVSKGVTIPSEIQGGMKEVKERLMKLTGKSFDEAFLKQMVDDHTATIAKFEDESKNGADADAKKFAADTLPTLRGHLAKAKALQKKV